jgi:hypothetical protein
MPRVVDIADNDISADDDSTDVTSNHDSIRLLDDPDYIVREGKRKIRPDLHLECNYPDTPHASSISPLFASPTTESRNTDEYLKSDDTDEVRDADDPCTLFESISRSVD